MTQRGPDPDRTLALDMLGQHKPTYHMLPREGIVPTELGWFLPLKKKSRSFQAAI